MADRTTAFVDRVAQAIGDPGSIVGMKGEDESVPRWSTRAVLTVLAQTAEVELAIVRAYRELQQQ